MLLAHDPVVWFVAFKPAPAIAHPRWWTRALHAGYRHCLAARQEGDATLVLDHAGSRLRAELVPVPIGAFLRGLQEHAACWVLMVALPMAGAAFAWLRPPMTCVELVKAALGIRAWWIVTPRQLARHLRSHLGAVPVLPIPEERSRALGALPLPLSHMEPTPCR